jgi:organic radical activating enzyme
MEIKKVFLDDSKPKYFTIDWMLHNRCTYNCSYCPPANKRGDDEWLKIDQLKLFCSHAETHAHTVDANFKMEAYFSGGEPTVWKDFIPLVDFLTERGWMIGVCSNASRSSRWWEEHAKKFSRINLSYHTEQVDDDEFIEKILICEKYTNIGINIMLNPDHEKFYKAVKFMDRLRNETLRCGFNHYKIQPYFGGIKINVAEYNDQQLEIIKKLRGRLNLGYNSDVTSTYLAEKNNGKIEMFDPMTLLREDSANFQNWQCKIGLERIFVDSRGYVSRGTCRVNGYLGNILDPDNIRWPSFEIICPKNWCGCKSDMLCSKIKPV